MADPDGPKEPALPAKRKPDLTSQDHQNLPPKSRKLQSTDKIIQAKEGIQSTENHAVEPSGNNDSSVPQSKHQIEQPGNDPEEEDDDYEDDDDEDDELDEDEDNGNAAVDRKGKGVLVEEKNDSEDDDDTGSSDGGNGSEGESDLSDDPLAEVDLDNILPSRTRRRAVQPGVYIAKDGGNNGGDADDSDDSDA
ncbi:hypothetical protein PTKIN_Ptkin07bG0004000 [Pterospermum kingtungense]